MPKVKKFDAAEKHFLEKEAKFNRMLKNEQLKVQEARTELERIQLENQALRTENEMLRAQNAELLQLTKMSEEELQDHIQKAANASKAVDLLTGLSSYATTGRF